MKRPSAYWHMMKWGLLSGTVLASLFILFFVSIDTTLTETLLFAINPFVWLVGFFFGGISGIILGWFEAIFIKRQVKDVPDPFTDSDMQEKRLSVYTVAAMVPIVAHLGITALIGMLGEPDAWIFYLFFFGIVTIIASVASAYAAHRYLFRLKLHGMQLGQTYDKQKNDGKRKLDTGRLEDHDDFFDDAVEDLMDDARIDRRR